MKLNNVDYLSAGLVVVQVHQRDRALRVLPALPSVLGVHEGSGKGDPKVNVVRTTGPLKKNRIN